MAVSMSEELRYVITSDDYVDLIVSYLNYPIIDEIPNSVLQPMNEAFAILYSPESQLHGRSLGNYGFTIIPDLYGLTSEEALQASGVTSIRRISGYNLRGEGVLIGLIDTGINYTLPAFKKADGTTKVYSIWDQSIQSENYPENLYFGTEYSKQQINEALNSEDPFAMVPSKDEIGHGTMLAAVAAGTEDPIHDFTGVAPDAELIVVKLMQAKKPLREFFEIPEGIPCFQENSIMWGLQYCINKARSANRPIAICLGLGSSQGAHDGISPLGSYSSDLAVYPKTGIVISAGNEGNLGRHYRGIIDSSIGYNAVELNVGAEDTGFVMQLWGDAPGIYSIDILTPSGEYMPRIPASIRVNREFSFVFERTNVIVIYQTVETETGDQLILVRFHNAAPGIWKFNVYGQGELTLGFHIWLPMGEFITRDTYFLDPEIHTTVLNPGDAYVPITVTAYNPANNALYTNASRGYTRANVIKPELAAPGVNYLAPDLEGNYTTYTGTGVASAHSTGIVALMLEWGHVLNNQPNISTTAIKNYLIRGARRSSRNSYPNSDWGYGIIDLYNTYYEFRIDI